MSERTQDEQAAGRSVTRPGTGSSGLTDVERIVGAFYDQMADDEQVRLEKAFPVEYLMTARYLERHVPERSVVADVGVGGGQYDELLARRQCRLYLADVSERLLQGAVARLDSCGLGAAVIDARVASAARLSHLGDASVDGILLLGPLYHLLAPGERHRAVAEANRVLKPGGVLFASAVNRLVGVLYGFALEADRGNEQLSRYLRFLDDGLTDPEFAPGIGRAYFATPEEFAALFVGQFDTIMLAGLESVTATRQESFPDLSRADRAAWLEILELVAESRDALAMSEHLLFVGRKAAAQDA